MDYKARLLASGVAAYEQPFAYRPDAKFTKETPSNIRLVATEFKPYRLWFDSTAFCTVSTSGNTDTYTWENVSIPRGIKKGKLFLAELNIVGGLGAATNGPTLFRVSLLPFIHARSYDTASQSTATRIATLTGSNASTAQGAVFTYKLANPEWEFLQVYSLPTATQLRLVIEQVLPPGVTSRNTIQNIYGEIVIIDESDD